MECDLCGTSGTLLRARIEGSVVKVCARCAQHGEVVERATPRTTPRVSTMRASTPEKRDVVLLVRSDFSRRIKDARERLGLKQEALAQRLGIKLSQLHKYETGSQQPDLETARHLERVLHVSLIHEQVEEERRSGMRNDAGPLTIGDVVRR